MDEDSDVDKDLDSSLLLDLQHGLDSSAEDNSSVLDKEEFLAVKGAHKMEPQTEGIAIDQINMLQEMVQEMKRGFQTAVEELGKIQAKEDNEAGRGKQLQKQQQQLDDLTETLHEIKNQLNVLTKDVDQIKDEQKCIKEQLEEVRSNRGSSQDRISHSDCEVQQVPPLPDSELPPIDWNYKISDFPVVEDSHHQPFDKSSDTQTINDSEVTSIACKSLSLTQALADKCLRMNHMESSDEEEQQRSANRRVSHYTPKTSQLVLQEAGNRRHSMPVVPTPENTTRDVLNAAERQRTVKELADSERDYCSKLWSLLNNYLSPLQSGGFFSSRELDVLIPQYMEQLYAEHYHICTGLQERLVHWTHIATLADLFTRVTDSHSIDSILPLYQEYAEDLPTAITCLKRALHQSTEFKDFLKAIKHSSCVSDDLMSLIMTPVQHMPRFLLQLQQVVKYTPTTHLDYPLLQTSLQRLRSFVNQLNKDVSNAMQVLSQENSLRVNGNETQVSQLSVVDSSLHFNNNEEENITSARAMSKSAHSHVQSEWLDDSYSHRALQQYDDVRHHKGHPLSAHANALSQPDLTNINGFHHEVSGHFPRSQSTLPSTAAADGFAERQFRHYKIKKFHKSPGRAYSQDYIHPSQSPRTRPSSAIDFIGNGPHQYQYSLSKRLYPGPLPRPHSALGPLVPQAMDGQHKPVIISRKHLRRSQPLAGSKMNWSETTAGSIVSPLAYPRMKEDDDDDEDDTRTSDTHSLGTSGSHPHSGSHCSNDYPDHDLNHSGHLQSVAYTPAPNLDLVKPIKFSAAEVTASLAKKLYPDQNKPQSRLTKSEMKLSSNDEDVSTKSGNPFKDNILSSTSPADETLTNEEAQLVANMQASKANSIKNPSPNPFLDSVVNSEDKTETLPLALNTTVEDDAPHSEVPQLGARGDNKRLSERNKQFLLSLAHMPAGDGYNKHSFHARGAGETNTTSSENSKPQVSYTVSKTMQVSYTASKTIPPQPPPRTSRIPSIGLESTFHNGTVETNYIGPTCQSDMKSDDTSKITNGPTQVISDSTNGAESIATMFAADSTQNYQNSISQGPNILAPQPYRSPLDPFTPSSVKFTTTEMQPSARQTNPFLTSSRNKFNPAPADATSTSVTKRNDDNLQVMNLNSNGTLKYEPGDAEPSDDVRKIEGMKSRQGPRLSQSLDGVKASDDPMAARKKMHFKASIKNLFSKKKGSVILADVEREVVMAMACATVSAASTSVKASGPGSHRADGFKSSESIEGKAAREELAFEIKTRKDQGSSTSSPVKVSKLFHHQLNIVKKQDRNGKDSCELSKDESKQTLSSMTTSTSQISSLDNPSAIIINETVKGDVKKDIEVLSESGENITTAPTVHSDLNTQDRKLHQRFSDPQAAGVDFLKAKKGVDLKQQHVKALSSKGKGTTKDSICQIGVSESDTLLIRKFDKDYHPKPGKAEVKEDENQARKDVNLCYKCQLSDTDQTKKSATVLKAENIQSNLDQEETEKNANAGKFKSFALYRKSREKSLGATHLKFETTPATVVDSLSDELSCAERLRPCSNAIKMYEQNISSQLKLTQNLESSKNNASSQQISDINKLPSTSHNVKENTEIKTEVHRKKEDKNGHVLENHSAKNSENKITKTFLKLFLPSGLSKGETNPKSEFSRGADSDQVSPNHKSFKLSESADSSVTMPASPTTVLTSSKLDKGISKSRKLKEGSPKVNDESSLQDVSKSKAKCAHLEKSKPIEAEVLDTSKPYVLKGKDFDHHYRLYYDEEMVGNGDGSPGQTPPQKYKNLDNLMHSCKKKEIYRHYLKTRTSNDVFKNPLKDSKPHRSQTSSFNPPNGEHTQSQKHAFFDKDTFTQVSEKPHTVWLTEKQVFTNNSSHRENLLLKSCHLPDSADWSHIRPVSSQCSPCEASPSNPSLTSSNFLRQGNDISQVMTNRRTMESAACGIDGQKHSTGIPVMPIILPVVGSRDGLRNPLFNYWPSYLSRSKVNPCTNDHCQGEACITPVTEASEESKSEETAVKQDTRSSLNANLAAACDESNSYKPRKSQLTEASIRERRGGKIYEVDVQLEDLRGNNENGENLSSCLSNNMSINDTKTEYSCSSTSHLKSLACVVSCSDDCIPPKHGFENKNNIKDDDHKGTFSSACPKMCSSQSRQDNCLSDNSRTFFPRTSSPCELLLDNAHTQFSASNQTSSNSISNSGGGYETQAMCRTFEPFMKLRPEKRSRNKVLVNIGSTESSTTLVEHSNARHDVLVHSGKPNQRYNLDGVVMRGPDQKTRQASRSSNTEICQGFNHNIPSHPYQMNRPISHPHVDGSLLQGNFTRKSNKHWSLHADFTRTSPNNFGSAQPGRISGNDLSIRNSYFVDPKRNSPSSQSSHSANGGEGSQRNHLNKSPNHLGHIAHGTVQATPDLLPLDSKLKDEHQSKNKEKSVKQSQSLFSRLTQSSFSFFSRDQKPNNAPK